MSNPFREHTELERRGRGRFSRRVEEGPFWGMGTPHGGYLMALVLRAMQLQLDDASRRPRVFSQSFLGRIPPGEVVIEVALERAGRAVTSLSARVRAAGDVAAVATAVFARDREGPAFLDEPPPDVAPPDRADEEMLGFIAPVHARFDFHRRFGRDGTELPCEDGGWILPREPADWDHAFALVASDVWVPPIIRHPERVCATPSLHHAVHFGPDVQGGPSAAFLVRHRLTSGAGGLTDEDIALWTDDGRLLLRARQLRQVVEVTTMHTGG